MGKKILIVDDSAVMRKIIKSVLIKNGYSNIVEADDGETACGIFEKEQPDLVFMDIIMKNKSGLEALAYIKNSSIKSKVVMCSAMTQDTLVIEAIRLGAVDFITKPFKDEVIVKIINKFL